MAVRDNTVTAFLETLRELETDCALYRVVVHPAPYDPAPPESPGNDADHWPLLNVTAEPEQVCLVIAYLNTAHTVETEKHAGITFERFVEVCSEAAQLYPHSPVMVASEFEPVGNHWWRNIEAFIGHQLWVDDQNQTVCLQLMLTPERYQTRQVDQSVGGAPEQEG